MSREDRIRGKNPVHTEYGGGTGDPARLPKTGHDLNGAGRRGEDRGVGARLPLGTSGNVTPRPGRAARVIRQTAARTDLPVEEQKGYEAEHHNGSLARQRKDLRARTNGYSDDVGGMSDRVS